MKKKYILILLLLIFSIKGFAQYNNYILAKISYENKNYDLADTEILNYLSHFPNDDRAIYLCGIIKIKQQQYSDAINYLSKLSVRKYTDLYLLLSRAYAGTNDQNKAIFYLKNYLKQRNKVSVNHIVAYREFGNIADSQVWQDLWNKNYYSKKEAALLNAEELYHEAHYEVAENQLNSYILKYGAQAEVLFLKAQIASSQQNYKDALDYLNKAVVLSDNIKYLKAKADIEYQLKKFNKALATYAVALQKDSMDLSIYYARSIAYSAVNEHDSAIADIQKYLKYYPDKEKALKRYAAISYAAGDYLTAIRTYGKLIEKYPEKTAYFKLRATAYMKTHTYNYAVKDYSMALDLYPRDAEIYYQKGMAHFYLNQIEQACAAWQHARKYGNSKCEKLLYRYCRQK